MDNKETEKRNAELLTSGEAYMGEDTQPDIQNQDTVAEDTLLKDRQEEFDSTATMTMEAETKDSADEEQVLEVSYVAEEADTAESGDMVGFNGEFESEDITEYADTEENTEAEYEITAEEAESESDMIEAVDNLEAEQQDNAQEELMQTFSDDVEPDSVLEEADKGKGKKSKKSGRSQSVKERKPGAADKFIGKFAGSIKFKLIGAFIIPVILIIVLGVVSYTTAKNAICDSYTESSQSTIKKTADYYNLMFTNVKATATDIVNDSAFQEYFSGAYSSDPVKDASTYSTLRSSLSSTTLGNKAIANIYIFPSYGKAMYTYTTQYSDTEAYQKVKETDEAKLIDSNRSAWFSERENLDKQGFAAYSISFARQLLGTSKKGVGYIFFDLDVDYVTSPLSDIDMGAKSIIALVAPDNGEIVVSNYKEISEDTQYFVGQEFFASAIDAEEDNGSC